MKHWLILLVLLLPSIAIAQKLPDTDLSNPRIQSVEWTEGQEVLLTALPSSGMTVMLEPGEQIQRVTTGGAAGFDIRVSSERDYLVRFLYEGATEGQAGDTQSEPAGGPTWSYRLRGDDPVRPQIIRDDAAKTYITYGDGQPLPAVFALGATGEEEVVNGYMRGGNYVIDRVYSELVFRIDGDRATARRNVTPDGQP